MKKQMKISYIFIAAVGYFLSADAKTTTVFPDSDIPQALAELLPGDTLLLNPGIYHVSPSEIARKTNTGPYAIVYDLSMSGEKGNPIVIKGMGDESGNRPVFDFSDVTLRDESNPDGYRITGFLISGSYIHISDLECVGLKVTRTDHTQSENFRIKGGAYNTLENISCHDGMGIGVYINGDSHHNLIVNCDAYNNYDPVSDISPRTGEGSGGNNDGFGCHVKGDMDGNIIIGCRAWRNTDDGFDLINCYSPVEISYCLAMENGYDAEGNNRADGNGVKGGGFGMKPRNIPLNDGQSPRHVIYNNVAIGNKANGLYSNHHLGGIDFISNTGIDNGNSNYSTVNRKGPEKSSNVDVNGYGHTLTENLSLSTKGKHTVWMKDAPSDAEVMCVDTEIIPELRQIYAPRMSNGMLAPETIEAVNNCRRESRGADFSKYPDAIERAKRITGADAE